MVGFRLSTEVDSHLTLTGGQHRTTAYGRRSHHLHIVTADTWDTRNERLFRDHLRSHPQLAREYGELKRRATVATA
jgi:GrpB-like predicted nucleotidyltransferase (UPF0157 family)